MSAPPRFGHVVLRTSRVAAMQDWYCAVLEARVVARTAQASFMTYDDEHHRVALVDAPPVESGREDDSRLAHIAFAHASVTALLEAYARLEVGGIAPARAVNHRLTASLYYRDPDGNWLELYADCGRALDPSLAEIVGASSPSWDPAALAQKLRVGASEDDLLADLRIG